MRKYKAIMLKLTLILASTLTLALSAATSATGQTPSVSDLRVTPLVASGVKSIVRTSSARIDDCADQLEIATQRLLKTLDALEKAEALVGFKDQEIAAKDRLIELQKEFVAIKDQMIAAQGELIKFYQAQKTKGKFRSVMEKIQKVLVLAAGIYIGKGL